MEGRRRKRMTFKMDWRQGRNTPKTVFCRPVSVFKIALEALFRAGDERKWRTCLASAVLTWKGFWCSILKLATKQLCYNMVSDRIPNEKTEYQYCTLIYVSVEMINENIQCMLLAGTLLLVLLACLLACTQDGGMSSESFFPRK